MKKTSSLSELRKCFTQNGIYKVDTISHLPPKKPNNYSDILLQLRLDIVHKYAHGSKLLDVCCATGQHLIGFRDAMQLGVGVDFSLPYIKRANVNKDESFCKNANFICSDAKNLPFHSNYFDLAYSFSSLSLIPEVRQVINEISRVLKIGGICVLDLGNLYSLNAIVLNSYNKELGWPAFLVSTKKMKQLLMEAHLKIIIHRAFQLFPLWAADRPKYLRFILLPFWARLLSKQVKGKMLDEWISSLPILKYFAFRHIFVCEKR